MGDKGVVRGFDWEGASDLTALSEGELGTLLGALPEEEQALGYKLEVLRGRIDVIRAEISRRGAYGSIAPEDLARVLLLGGGGP